MGFLTLSVSAFGCTATPPDPTPPAPEDAGSPALANGGSSGSSTSGTGTTAGTGTVAGGAAGSVGNSAGTGGAFAGAATGGSANGGMAGSTGGATADFCKSREGLTLCETFEGQMPGAAQLKPPWATAINGDGTVSIDDSVAHGGGRSLKVHGSGFSAFLVLGGAPLPSATGRLHVRMFMRIAEAMTGGHNTFLVADTVAAPGAGNAFRLGEMNAMLMYTLSGDTHGALANDNFYSDNLPGAALAPLTWGCIEVALDHSKPEVQVWLDGKDISDLHHTDWAVDGYDALRFGFEKYAGPVGDVWYDDIAVGTAPLGCD